MRIRGLLLLLVVPLVAQADTTARPTLRMKVKDFQLDMRDYAFPSGLRVVFQVDHSQPVVAVTSTVDYGSAADPPELDGIAHCVEHLWFRSVHKDTAGRDLPKVWDILMQMGGNINASTADDWTNYMTVASRDNLVPILRLESLRLSEPVAGVTEDVLRVEREVIRNELRLRYENGFVGFVDTVNGALFPKGHPYHRLGIGTHDTLDAITMDDVRAFAAAHYSPASTTITVVGDFDLDDTPRLLNEFRRDQLAAPGDTSNTPVATVQPTPRINLTAPAPEPPDPLLPAEVKGEVVNLNHRPGAVDERQLVLAWALPGAYHTTDWDLRLATNEVSYAILQELYPSWEWTKEAPPVDTSKFGCFLWDSKLASRTICVIPLEDTDDPAKVTERALNGLSRIWATDETYRMFQQHSFELGLTQVQAQVFASVDRMSTLDARATSTSAWTHFTGDPRYFSTSFQLLSSVNGDEVRHLAEKYLTRTRAVATVVTPYEDGDIDIHGDTTRWRGSRRDEAADRGMSAEEAEALVVPAVVPPDRKAISVGTLDNGLELVTMPYSTSPLVQVSLRFPTGGGLSAEAHDRLEYAVDQTRNDSYLSVEPLRIGATEHTTFDPRQLTFALTAPAGNVNEAVYILRARVDGLIAYTDGKLDWSKARKRDVLDGMKDASTWAARLLDERLYPGHPFSRRLGHADYERLAKGSAADVAATLGEVLRPDNATLTIVGNITREEADTAARTWWNGWTGWAHKKPTTTGRLSADWAPPPAPPARQVVLLDKPETSQTEVEYRCQLEPGDAALALRQGVLGEVVSDNAWLSLREATGASYGASARAVRRGGLVDLDQEVLVQNDATAQAIQAFFAGVDAVRAGRIDKRVLAVSKLTFAQSWVLGHQSTEQMMSRLTNVLGTGPDRFDWFDRYANTLAAIHAEDLPPLLDRCVGHEVVVATGPLTVVRPQLDAAGVPYEVFDWKAATADYRAANGLKPQK